MNPSERPSQKIACPNCGSSIDVNELVFQQLNEQLEKKYTAQLAAQTTKIKAQLDLLDEEKATLLAEKETITQKINAGITEGLTIQKKELEQKLVKRIQEEQSEQIRALHDELNEKSSQLKEFNKAKSDIERLKREKEELRGAIEAENEKKINALLRSEREKMQLREDQKTQLKVAEKEQIITQLKLQLQEAQRKAEQGSTQLQGEVQELAIQDWLSRNFPLDTVEEIKKGAKGADCIQSIHTRQHQNCGSIYYESKRSKTFQVSWIEKFKDDIRLKGADVGVLITETMPSDMQRMGFKDGIWICTFEEFKGLSTVLRESLINIHSALASQQNKGDKMEILYRYLTGNEFRLQIEAIVEGFVQLQHDLDSEKRSMQSIWKKREKQIEKVLLNTNFMYSSIKGIAGNAVPSVSLLEYPPDTELE